MTLATLSVVLSPSQSWSMRLMIRLCRLSGRSSALQRGRILRIDAAVADKVDHLLDVEWVALRLGR